MTSLYFVVTGVQYWGTAYLSVTLSARMPLVNLLFIVCAATGPTLGVFFGGYVIDVLGGYRGMRQRVVALELCCVFGKWNKIHFTVCTLIVFRNIGLYLCCSSDISI